MLPLDQILHGDCLSLFPQIPDASIDFILCDLPYDGLTRCKWDQPIDLEALWVQYHRVCKKNAAVCLFASWPFSHRLAMSNIRELRYEWVWEKTNGSGHLNAKKRPMKVHENILVFYGKQPTYNPQMEEGKPYKIKGGRSNSSECYRPGLVRPSSDNDGSRYPRDVLRFGNENKAQRLHPTQKPVALCEYFVKTYTNEGEVVLDNCFGSGTTLLAAKKTGRHFIGMERDEEYVRIARERLEANGLLEGKV